MYYVYIYTNKLSYTLTNYISYHTIGAKAQNFAKNVPKPKKLPINDMCTHPIINSILQEKGQNYDQHSTTSNTNQTIQNEKYEENNINMNIQLIKPNKLELLENKYFESKQQIDYIKKSFRPSV